MSPSQQHAIALAQAATIGKDTANKAHRLNNRHWGNNYLLQLYRNNTPLKDAAINAFAAQLNTLNPTTLKA